MSRLHHQWQIFTWNLTGSIDCVTPECFKDLTVQPSAVLILGYVFRMNQCCLAQRLLRSAKSRQDAHLIRLETVPVCGNESEGVAPVPQD